MRLVGWAVVIAELLLLGWLVWLYSQGTVVITFDKGADVATLALTAATLVVTGVAVAVAVATIWGYREIRQKVIEAATRDAKKIATAISKDTAGSVAARTAREAIEPITDKITVELENMHRLAAEMDEAVKDQEKPKKKRPKKTRKKPA